LTVEEVSALYLWIASYEKLQFQLVCHLGPLATERQTTSKAPFFLSVFDFPLTAFEYPSLSEQSLVFSYIGLPYLYPIIESTAIVGLL